MQEEIKEILEIFKKINEEYSVDTELDFEDYEIPNIYLKQFLDYITNLQEKLEVSQTNEETYRLEMQDITKCLGLKEDTIFDEVKEYATNLQEENEYFNHCDEEKRKTITNLRYKIERLEEDNKNLKELCDKYEEEHGTAFELWKNSLLEKKNLQKENERLNNIIDGLEKVEKVKE